MPRRTTAKVGLIFDTTDEHKTSATGLTCFGAECQTPRAKREGQNLVPRLVGRVAPRPPPQSNQGTVESHPGPRLVLRSRCISIAKEGRSSETADSSSVAARCEGGKARRGMRTQQRIVAS